jgi:hypothetical protein
VFVGLKFVFKFPLSFENFPFPLGPVFRSLFFIDITIVGGLAIDPGPPFFDELLRCDLFRSLLFTAPTL